MWVGFLGYTVLTSRLSVAYCIAAPFSEGPKRPCDCCVGQFWPNVTGRRYFADTVNLSSTTVMCRLRDNVYSSS